MPTKAPKFGPPLTEHIPYVTKNVRLQCPKCLDWHVLNLVVDSGSNTTLLDEKRLCDRPLPRGLFSRSVAFPRTTIKVPEMRVPAARVLETLATAPQQANGVVRGIALDPFCAGIMDMRGAIPLFPSHVDGILGTNALKGCALRVSPTNREVVVSRGPVPKNVVNDYVELRLDVTENPEKSSLGKLLFARTSMGQLLVDTGNQSTMFCTSDNTLCEHGSRDLRLETKNASPGEMVYVKIDKAIRRRDPPGSLVAIGRSNPNIQAGGNIGILLMRNSRFFSDVVMDLHKNRVFVKLADDK